MTVTTFSLPIVSFARSNEIFSGAAYSPFLNSTVAGAVKAEATSDNAALKLTTTVSQDGYTVVVRGDGRLEAGQKITLTVDALFVAAAVGQAIATQASISGAEGGCQAECGSAAAMAAAALVYLEGGNPQQCADAAAFALMNLLGLVCDPVGGLVEVPCVYRNVGASGIAFTAADMVLSGIRCPIEPDEVILAMKEVGDALPTSLRETGEGGCAACESICKRLHHKE